MVGLARQLRANAEAAGAAVAEREKLLRVAEGALDGAVEGAKRSVAEVKAVYFACVCCFFRFFLALFFFFSFRFFLSLTVSLFLSPRAFPLLTSLLPLLRSKLSPTNSKPQNKNKKQQQPPRILGHADDFSDGRRRLRRHLCLHPGDVPARLLEQEGRCRGGEEGGCEGGSGFCCGKKGRKRRRRRGGDGGGEKGSGTGGSDGSCGRRRRRHGVGDGGDNPSPSRSRGSRRHRRAARSCC